MAGDRYLAGYIIEKLHSIFFYRLSFTPDHYSEYTSAYPITNLPSVNV